MKIDYKSSQENFTDEEYDHVYRGIWHVQWSHLIEYTDIHEGNLTDMQIFDAPDLETEAVVAYEPVTDTILYIFRATYTDFNWIEDYDIIPVDYYEDCDCKVNQGFWMGYQALGWRAEPYVIELT